MGVSSLDGVDLLLGVGGDVVVAEDRALEVGEMDGDRGASTQSGTPCEHARRSAVFKRREVRGGRDAQKIKAKGTAATVESGKVRRASDWQNSKNTTHKRWR